MMDQNHGLTPLEKTQFFEFLTSSLYILERRFFAREYHKTHFPALDCRKKRRWKNGQFWTKTNFSTFSTPCFYSIERRFFPIEYHKTHSPSLDYLKKIR